MTQAKQDIIGLTSGELESFAASYGEPPYRGRQLYDWIYRRRAAIFKEMTDLPSTFRATLDDSATIQRLTLTKQTGPALDGATKFLFELAGGLHVETVYLPDSPGETICVSSQVGCALGCRFCATGQMGFFRNLTTGEIVQQIRSVEQITGQIITNVVFMGMGEPLHNYDAVNKALTLLTDKAGMAIPARRITVSTAGIVPMIDRWCDENPPAKLAISLHATTDERRIKLMPVAKAFPLEALMKAIRKLAHVTRYPVTFEYIMIAGFNDRREDAANLRSLLRNIPAKVNLIRLHPTGSDLVPSTDYAIEQFMRWLVEEGIPCTLRESRGVSNSAACGMLYTKEKPRSAERSL